MQHTEKEALNTVKSQFVKTTYICKIQNLEWKKLSLELNSAILLYDAIGNRKYGEFKIQFVDTEMA